MDFLARQEVGYHMPGAANSGWSRWLEILPQTQPAAARGWAGRCQADTCGKLRSWAAAGLPSELWWPVVGAGGWHLLSVGTIPSPLICPMAGSPKPHVRGLEEGDRRHWARLESHVQKERCGSSGRRHEA